MATSKADQAYGILRSRITRGTYGAGHRLVVDQLVREHAISSVPWREALRRLEAEGWVEIVPNVGALVRAHDADDWERSMHLLARLEGLGTALSSAHLTPDDLDEARNLNARMRAALETYDGPAYGELHRRLHAHLCSRSGDARLTSLLEHEWIRAELIRNSASFHAPGRAVAVLEEHDALIDLIAAGTDADAVESATRAHILGTLEAVINHEAGQTAP
ncbi:MAG: GntR family transcriptional regulator [Demequina sp.]|uniref:GntR family transcriptional regulator n=1 Tax=Demequina sp. TaxID=2050685 RepID=UPI003A87A903